MFTPIMISALSWLLFVPLGSMGQEPDAVAAKLQKLQQDFESDRRASEFAPRFLRLAQEHADHPAAVDALVWVILNRRYRPEAAEATTLLETKHIKQERLAAWIPKLASVVSLENAKLLEAAMEKSPHRPVRAQALLALATLLEEQARLAEQLEKDPASKPRVTQYYNKQVTEHLATLDRKVVDRRRETLYEQMAKEYRDVATPSGPMGELADKALFAIRHLAVGRPAPEIDAEDIDGKRFKLSDFRGKVVVLSFWGHW